MSDGTLGPTLKAISGTVLFIISEMPDRLSVKTSLQPKVNLSRDNGVKYKLEYNQSWELKHVYSVIYKVLDSALSSGCSGSDQVMTQILSSSISPAKTQALFSHNI